MAAPFDPEQELLAWARTDSKRKMKERIVAHIKSECHELITDSIDIDRLNSNPSLSILTEEEYESIRDYLRDNILEEMLKRVF